MEELVNKVNAAFEAFKADAALQVESVPRTRKTHERVP